MWGCGFEVVGGVCWGRGGGGGVGGAGLEHLIRRLQVQIPLKRRRGYEHLVNKHILPVLFLQNSEAPLM